MLKKKNYLKKQDSKQVAMHVNKQIKQKNNELAVTQEQRDKYFEKYSNKYKDKPEDIRKANIYIQREVYEKIHVKGIENTNIERLLDITINECQEQFEIKQSVENRTGLIIALWGVLIATLLQGDIPLKNVDIILNSNNHIVWRIIVLVVLAGQLITGGISLFFIYKTIKTYGYSMYSLKSKDNHFNAAVDDKYISIVQLLDTYTNNWNTNYKALEEKNKYYKRLMKTILLFILFVVASYVCPSQFRG